MGKLFIDQYSLLHAASGVIAYFWGISLPVWFVLHVLFEVVENTPFGMYIITEYIPFWPGGKTVPDTFINSVGDQVFAVLGWLLAYYVDRLGLKYGWYTPHLTK